jgi:hypothetical protein
MINEFPIRNQEGFSIGPISRFPTYSFSLKPSHHPVSSVFFQGLCTNMVGWIRKNLSCIATSDRGLHLLLIDTDRIIFGKGLLKNPHIYQVWNGLQREVTEIDLILIFIKNIRYICCH